MPQIISEIFSYSFVFLLGVIVGALGEMFLGGHRTPKRSVSESLLEQQVNDVLPVNKLPQSTDTSSVSNFDRTDSVEPVLPLTSDAPIVLNTSVPSSNKKITPEKPGKGDAKKPVKELSIAEQIDEILEEMQKFSTTGLPTVSLIDDRQKGVIVKVGSQSYSGIETVPDEFAQELIKKAVAEWERRSSRK